MRVFHLISSEFGMKALGQKRLKISRFANLNDPFELLGADLRDRAKRIAFQGWKRQIDERFGLLCFSRDWQSPVLWSHYGEKHHGMCLGFDVPDDRIMPIRYSETRTELDDLPLNEETALYFLTSKYLEWSYEKEVRTITDLVEKDPDDGKFYADFSTDLALKEIIIGALSKVTREYIISQMEHAGLNTKDVSLVKARLAFKSYAIVPDKRGLR